MGHVQVFDVNETLLDLAAMDPHFQRIFGDPGVRVAWFNQMLQSALVATVTGAYHPFGDHALAALVMTADQAGVPLADDDKQAVAAQMRQLPAHPEVAGALRRLGDAGLRLAALTNSTEEAARAQLQHAGLIDTFELVLSADTVGRLKPAPEPYRMAAERLGVPVGQVRLIAAHAWDVAGAAGAGCATAFVARPGKVLDPLVERPEIVGADLTEVADAILAADQSDNRGAYRQRPPHQPDNDAGGGRQASSEGAPDARAPVTGQHGQADGDLNQTDDALEDDVPGRDIGGQDAGQLQDRHWHAQHPGEEGHQDQPEDPPPAPKHADGQQSDERGQRG
jgi:2-haloacid dehalogenase